MKTIREWLKERLSEEDYKRARNYEREGWKYEESNFRDALVYAFHWRHTREGEDYWFKICAKGGSLLHN